MASAAGAGALARPKPFVAAEEELKCAELMTQWRYAIYAKGNELNVHEQAFQSLFSKACISHLKSVAKRGRLHSINYQPSPTAKNQDLALLHTGFLTSDQCDQIYRLINKAEEEPVEDDDGESVHPDRYKYYLQLPLARVFERHRAHKDYEELRCANPVRVDPARKIQHTHGTPTALVLASPFPVTRARPVLAAGDANHIVFAHATTIKNVLAFHSRLVFNGQLKVYASPGDAERHLLGVKGCDSAQAAGVHMFKSAVATKGRAVGIGVDTATAVQHFFGGAAVAVSALYGEELYSLFQPSGDGVVEFKLPTVLHTDPATPREQADFRAAWKALFFKSGPLAPAPLLQHVAVQYSNRVVLVAICLTSPPSPNPPSPPRSIAPAAAASASPAPMSDD